MVGKVFLSKIQNPEATKEKKNDIFKYKTKPINQINKNPIAKGIVNKVKDKQQRGKNSNINIRTINI